jgi:Na+/phosphate symporter
MEKLKKYAPHIIFIGFIAIFTSSKGTITKEWIGIVLLIIGVILLIEFIESSRPKRINKWHDKHPDKITQMLKFSIFLGLPVSAIIIFVIHSKAELFYSILFIAVPVVFIFGWFGLIDWQKCEKTLLEEKYKVNLPN